MVPRFVVQLIRTSKPSRGARLRGGTVSAGFLAGKKLWVGRISGHLCRGRPVFDPSPTCPACRSKPRVDSCTPWPRHRQGGSFNFGDKSDLFPPDTIATSPALSFGISFRTAVFAPDDFEESEE